MRKYVKASSDSRKIPYDLVSELVILRDYADVSRSYLTDEHEKLVDIADTLYNAGIPADKLLPEFKDVYDRYGKDYFDLVLDDVRAIDSQIRPNNVQDLIDEYVLKADEFENGSSVESAVNINCVGHNDYKRDELYYSDNFCTMRYLDDGYVLYTDRSGDYFPVPIRWAEKIIDFFSNGDLKKADHYLDMAKEKQPKDFSYDKYVNSSTIINCVGHNDPGKYFDLIDYFDVWGNEEDGWEVNDQTVVEEKIWISDDTTEEELFNYLKDTVGYFNRNTKFSDVEIQWDDPDFIEIFQASDGCPVCSLRVSYRE